MHQLSAGQSMHVAGVQQEECGSDAEAAVSGNQYIN
jgi:hypothetical protein